uniref:TBC1 domain family member 22B n=1 Tax=Anas platyrhynchos platyrhynchos TaxID=8840 RepID=U3I2X6_ANAPP
TKSSAERGALDLRLFFLSSCSIQPVYGAQHPPLDPRLTKNFIKDRSKANALPAKSKKASSFHEFARNTSDAWDIGDDEDEDFSSSSSSLQTLNSKVAKATAAQVLENHSKLRANGQGARWGCRGAVPSLLSPWPPFPAEEACVRTPLQKQQSLPLRPVIPLVARISDQNASGAPPMTVREKTRLEKFRQLLSSHNTDLGECSCLPVSSLSPSHKRCWGHRGLLGSA